MGRPTTTRNIFQNTRGNDTDYADNTLGVLQYAETGGMAMVDLSAREHGGREWHELPTSPSVQLPRVSACFSVVAVITSV